MRMIHLVSVLFFGCSAAIAQEPTQQCLSNVYRTTPVEDFEVINEFVAVQKSTGLMWSRCIVLDDVCDVQGNYLSIGDALIEAENSNYAGYTDWRLPNMKQ